MSPKSRSGRGGEEKFPAPAGTRSPIIYPVYISFRLLNLNPLSDVQNLYYQYYIK